MTRSEVFLVETRAGIETRWYCPPPPEDLPHIVTDFWWSGPGQNVREIYAWKLMPNWIDCGTYALKIIPAPELT